VFCVLGVPEVILCVLLCILEAVEGGLCLLEVPEVMRCVLFYMLKAAEGGHRLLEVLDVLDVPEEMRSVLLCTLEVAEVVRSAILCGGGGAHCATLCAGGARGAGRDGRAGGDTLCVTLYAGGCGGCALFAGGAGDDTLRGTLYAGGSGGSALLLVPEVIRGMVLCMLEAVEDGLCLLEVLEAVGGC